MRSDYESKARRLALTGALAVGALCVLLAGAQPTSAGGPEKPNRYIGAQKCKNCHQAESAGNQYGTWTHMKHSQAFEVLASDQAKAYGAERGVADPQKSEQCLKCHVTAFNEPKEHIKKGFKPESGVQCESCHGPGEKHFKVRFASASEAVGEDGERKYVAVPDDEIIRQPTMKTCLGCHNEESPSFKPFCFHERVAKIRHLNPLKPRTDEELKALLVCGCGDKCSCVNGCDPEKCGAPAELAPAGD